MKRYRIISLDGGGIKGIVSATILHRLNSDPVTKDFIDQTDLIAGTSTGGLLALGIAKGLKPSFMQDIYMNEAKNIFDDSWLDNIKDIGRLMGAEYDNKNLEKILINVFGKQRLKQLNKKVIITAFDLDNESKDKNERCWKPKIFHNFPGKDSDGEEYIYKVGLYTSAAPTYFPSMDGYIDGGVFANNPSMCALSQSQDSRFFERPPSFSKISLLSIGSGTSLNYIKDKYNDWGYAQWIKPLISIMMDGVNGIADYECRQILNENYCRIAPVFPYNISIPLDGIDKILYMKKFGEDIDLTGTKKWLTNYWI